MKAVILAGGLGTRMESESEFRPKPMAQIGDRPILHHIMDGLLGNGIDEFVVLAGYKAQVIKDYFLNLQAYSHDLKISFSPQGDVVEVLSPVSDVFTVKILDTGIAANTGLRLLLARKHLESEPFFLTYGDGLSTVSIPDLVACHTVGGRVGTVTITRPPNRFGVVASDPTTGIVTSFDEKQPVDSWINIGHFIFEPTIFDFLVGNEPLETGLLKRLVNEGELNSFRHTGFWAPIDTPRELKAMRELWDSGNAPWRPAATRPHN